MITKLVKRYYCEFCRKGGMTKGIQKHENSCIKNPNRVCYVCEEFGFEQKPLPELIDQAAGGIPDIVSDCPCCILSALVQRRIAHPDEEWVEYDYKEAMNGIRRDRNAGWGPGFEP